MLDAGRVVYLSQKLKIDSRVMVCKTFWVLLFQSIITYEDTVSARPSKFVYLAVNKRK